MFERPRDGCVNIAGYFRTKADNNNSLQANLHIMPENTGIGIDNVVILKL